MIAHLKGNAVAYLALFVALGGVSWAAVTLPRNSVGAKQIKKNAVRSGEVKDRSLRAGDFARGQLPAGPRGAVGPIGPEGPKGDKGDVGPTFADVGGGGTLQPAADPDQPFTGLDDEAEYTFTLPSPGRVLVDWHARLQAACDQGAISIGIYVDDEAVPDSARLLPGSVIEVSLVGVADSLTAGEHTAKAVVDCPTGSFIDVAYATGGTWSVVLVGG